MQKQLSFQVFLTLVLLNKPLHPLIPCLQVLEHEKFFNNKISVTMEQACLICLKTINQNNDIWKEVENTGSPDACTMTF